MKKEDFTTDTYLLDFSEDDAVFIGQKNLTGYWYLSRQYGLGP